MFSSPSFNSISFATVTPSLVMVGDPNFFSITTLRPLGPRVTFTASARILTPRRIAWRDSSPCTICFAIIRISYQKLRIFLAGTPAEMSWVAWVSVTSYWRPTPDHYRRAPTVSLLATPDSTPRPSSSLHNQEFFAVNLDFSAGILSEQDVVSRFHRQREHLAVFIAPALAHGDDFALLRLVLRTVRYEDSAASGRRFFYATNQDAVVQRGEFRSHAGKLL